MLSSSEVKQLAIDIEEELHKFYKGTDSKYKKKAELIQDCFKNKTVNISINQYHHLVLLFLICNLFLVDS